MASVDWSADSTVVKSECKGYQMLYWNAVSGKQLRENQRDTERHTWTGALGFPVMGIWDPEQDGTDINTTDRSKTGEYVVTGDDSNKVKVFKYPCVVEGAPARVYTGRASHVMRCRFNLDDSWMIFVGSKDR